MERFPTFDLSLSSDDAIRTPYPYWSELRDLESAVWLTQHNIWVVSRYDEVKAVLGNWRLFTTAKGAAMNDRVNQAVSGPGRANSLISDPPLHFEAAMVSDAFSSGQVNQMGADFNSLDWIRDNGGGFTSGLHHQCSYGFRWKKDMKTGVKINLMKSAPFILVCVAMGGTTAIAQNAAPSNNNDFVLEEIVVTAQKRTQSAQDVPISISALNGDSIRERGVVAASDLVGQFVNLTSSSANSATVNFNIRGIATDNFQSNINRSVGVYIDEVTQANPFTGVYGVFDTQRVEVLRGPQNTLNGRNTTGGAINFISVKPEIGGGSTGYGNATYGRFNRIDVEGAVGFDVASGMAARVAGQMQLRDGPFTNFALGREGEELGEREKYSLRTQP